MFDLTDPFADGMLDVGDGQRVHWTASGNPDGKPALLLHGGPGGGSSPRKRKSFDPAAYLIVQFDQRGCGRSTPPVSEPATPMTSNTTDHLIADMELLRAHLGIERWLIWGGSWGCTLGLAYAQRYPHLVTEMILVAVTMTRPYDVHWLYHETGRYFPEQWDRFRRGLPEGERDGDLVAAYDRLLNAHPDPAVRRQAAADWCRWEDDLLSNEEGWTPYPPFADPDYQMTFARTCAHYFSNAAWLADGQLLRDAPKLAGIPGVLIHGKFDLGGPPDVAWLLHKAWPGSELHLVDAGHRNGAELGDRMEEATIRFATR